MPNDDPPPLSPNVVNVLSKLVDELGKCSPCPGVEQAAKQPRSTRSGNGARRMLTRCPSGGLPTLGRPLLLLFSDGDGDQILSSNVR